jgi:DNA-binding HxlR family transcriptional regulator
METMNVNKELVDFQMDSFSENQRYDASACIMTKVNALMRGRWKPIILYLIRNDINRFGLLQKSMPSISKKVLTSQLRELERDNLISREVIEERHPQVIVYHLTTLGRSLRQLIDEMVQWGVMNLMVHSSVHDVQDCKENHHCEKAN